MPVEEYVKTLLENSLPISEDKAAGELTTEEEERLLDELAALGKHLPPPPAEEIYSRKTIYRDHD